MLCCSVCLSSVAPLPCGLRTRNEESGGSGRCVAGGRNVAVIGQVKSATEPMADGHHEELNWSGMQRAEGNT